MQRAQPVLVVISGPAGSGKTTLARALAGALRCPAICRDEIKEGMTHARRPEPAPANDLDVRTLETFFGVVGVLLTAGVTTVAEAAFQHHVWVPNLTPVVSLADLRVVQCHTEPCSARNRIATRAPRSAHADGALLAEIDDGRYFDDFRRLAIDAQSIDVDTTAGYDPSLDDIVSFVDHEHEAR